MAFCFGFKNVSLQLFLKRFYGSFLKSLLQRYMLSIYSMLYILINYLYIHIKLQFFFFSPISLFDEGFFKYNLFVKASFL